MGLNLDVDHVAFASDKKFDGFRFRKLYPAELGQIAGRAGRYMRDGTFGTTARCPPFDAETVEALENHTFEPVRVLQWRNADLDFLDASPRCATACSTSLASTGSCARRWPRISHRSRCSPARTTSSASPGRACAVERLWQVCQVPDYRKVSPQTHADLVGQIYRFLMKDGAVPADWFSRHVASLDRTDGDIDALSNRIAQVRTWSFVANRPDWLKDPEHWQGVARQVEDKLSDALHERLAQRFIDRRTSVLMRRLRENAMLEAEITASGDVTVEGQHVGHLHGFHFVPDPAGRVGGSQDPAQRGRQGARGRDRGAGRAVLSRRGHVSRPVQRRHDPLAGRSGREARARRQDLRAALPHPGRRAAHRPRPGQGRDAACGPGSRRISCGCSAR